MTGANGKLLQGGKEYTEIHFINLAEHIAAGDIVEVVEPAPAPDTKKTKSTQTAE